jgi:hypothetical protein
MMITQPLELGNLIIIKPTTSKYNKKEKPIPPTLLVNASHSSDSCQVLLFPSLLSLPFLPFPSTEKNFIHLAFSSLCDYTFDLRAILSHTEVHKDFVSSFLLSSSSFRYMLLEGRKDFTT